MRFRRLLARAIFAMGRYDHRSTVRPTDGVGVLVGAPHTSNWDFILMLALAWDLGISVKYFGKKSLFTPPFGWFMRALGGIPVDRANPAGLVDAVVARLEAGERFYLVVTPEGTRGKGSYWKSGFLRIATATGLSITLGYVDNPTRTTGLGLTFVPTGDVRADMDVVRAFYADKHGVRPALRTEPRLREEDTLDAADAERAAAGSATDGGATTSGSDASGSTSAGTTPDA
ncbi:1-acyl-sn-glycerol-3-phosphate acyltransferase [Sanguibacter sp. HDW7]|uniref:1-acyl-sn-glycerol-3-phosphate acyltransferase n=1 Tax=Sanguibacter sp. HDW7 TaxID=2714931 RepID=UPI00140C3FAA|nr:1-acyl-sn-glycerol-3-phosphate acyltransferase [Sanguibacter sp. HDW7]QIK84657.1 acyl-phosphate glycerol 3-phosphate acyltransferase [Sanguibacter sp. HDW7]